MIIISALYPARVQVFCKDFEDNFIILGIPAKTITNEVRLANFWNVHPILKRLNVAADIKPIVMTLIEKYCQTTWFLCLFTRKKPFAGGKNGSVKHVNWSVGNATKAIY